MADYNHEAVESFIAASQIGAYLPVFQNIASSRDDYVVPQTVVNGEIIGLTIATVPTYGDPVAVVLSGRAKAICAASVGAGALVGVASTNGALGPVLPSGITAHIGSGGDVAARYAVGRTLKAYAAGDVMTVIVDPRQVI